MAKFVVIFTQASLIFCSVGSLITTARKKCGENCRSVLHLGENSSDEYIQCIRRCRRGSIPNKGCQTAIQNITLQEGVITDLRVLCHLKGKKKIIRAQWFVPAMAENITDAFQIHYQVTDGAISHPLKGCMQVGHGSREVGIIFPNATERTMISLRIGIFFNMTLQSLPSNHFYCTEIFKASPKSYPFIIGGCMFVFAITAVVAWMIYKKRQTPLTYQQGPITFFSHCFVSEEDVMKLLSLANRLHSKYGIKCCIDLLDECTMEEMTEAAWRNKMYTDSEKFIIIFSKKYLQIFQDYIRKPNQDWSSDLLRLRVINDMMYIQNHLMARGCTNKTICLLTDGVKRKDLPCFLKSRAIFAWPLPESKDEKELVRCLMNVQTRAFMV